MSLEANMELGVCGDGCDHDVADCYNKGYCYYEHLQDEKDKEEKVIIDEGLCPVCGKKMNQTERGVHYCIDCEYKYLREDKISKSVWY